MTPSQAAQKERARMEAEEHLHHSAVDRRREAVMDSRMNIARSEDSQMLKKTKRVRDANNAYAGEE